MKEKLVATYVSLCLHDWMDSALKAIAEPHRREIVRLVWDHELGASAIATHFPDVSRPAISQHLHVLKAAHLLKERRDGTRRLYSRQSRRDGPDFEPISTSTGRADFIDCETRPKPPNE